MVPRCWLGIALLAAGCGGGGEGAPAPDVGALVATDLRCEYLVDPLGVDTPAPRLSWALRAGERGQRQTAYEIVATVEGATVWATGKVPSGQQSQLPYRGRALASGERVRWTV